MEISSSLPQTYQAKISKSGETSTLFGAGTGIIESQVKVHARDPEELQHEQEAQENIAAVWGTINIGGNIITIDENGGTESPMWLDIDWNIDGAQARADAIMQKYGGILQKGADAEIVNYDNIKSDFTEFWGKVLGDKELFSKFFDGSQIAETPDDFTDFLTSIYEENAEVDE